MSKRILRVLTVLLLAAMTVLASCSKKAEAQASADKAPAEKREFTIFNAAGMGEYYEKILLPAFQKAYGDRYEVRYETLGWADVITKIEAQGLQKGKGNINIVIVGDNGVAKGNESGVWMDLSGNLGDIKADDMTAVARDAFESYDNSVVPILFQHQDAGIAYVPSTPAGKALQGLIGDDGKIGYNDLKSFLLSDSTSPRFGRGRITKSGAGDAWTWGLFLQEGEYGKNANPDKSAAWASELYAKGDVKLYDGTSGTFTELTEGNLDVIAHSIPWFYRLHAKGRMTGLPEELKEDTKGLENAEFALMEGDNVKSLLAGHYFIIPSNLSDEQVSDSLAFIDFAIQPEVNANAYAGIAMPAYKSATVDKVSDPNVRMVWDEVRKYYPAGYQDEQGNIIMTEGSYEFYVTDVAMINKYVKTWQDKVEAGANN